MRRCHSDVGVSSRCRWASGLSVWRWCGRLGQRLNGPLPLLLASGAPLRGGGRCPWLCLRPVPCLLLWCRRLFCFLRASGRENTPPSMPDPGHGPSGGELGRPPPGPQLARWARVRASIRGPRLSSRWARPTWRSTAHRSVLLAPIARSLCNRNARGRAQRMRRSAAAPVDCAASQASSVSCGGAPAAPCIAASDANAFSVRFIVDVKCNRSCPNGKVQRLQLVKVARVVNGKKTEAERWPRELKVNIPSGYDNVNLIWSSRG